MPQTHDQPDAELMLWGRPADLHPLKLQVLPPEPPSRPRNRTLRIVDALSRRRTLFFTSILVCALAVGLLEFSRPAFYTASASLQVTPPANADAIAHLAEARQLWKAPAQAANLSELREYRWSLQGILRSLNGATPGAGTDESAQLARHLTMTPVAQGRVLEVEFQCSDPDRAAAFLNLFVAAVARNVTEMRMDGVESVRSTFAGQIAYARAQYQAIEDDLLVMTRVAAITGHLPEAPGSGNAARSEAALRFEAKRRDLESKRVAYEDLLRQERAAEYGAASDGDVRPIAAAHVLPVPRLGWLIASLAGAGLAFVVAVPLCLLRDATDPVVRYPADVAEQIGATLLGVVPHGLKRRRRKRGSVIDLNSGSEGDTELTAPGLAEAFRHLLTSVWIAGQKQKRPRVLLVTSASARDGKTTIVANLGVALANSRRRVLLVDADLRKPRVHTMFAVNANWGLANVLEQRAPLEDYDFDELYIKTDVPGLYVLPAGTGSLAIADLQNVDRLTELLMRARLEFHAVLIDTPGAVTFPETRVLAKLADAVILVVRANASRRRRVAGLARQFEEDGALVLGAVLNDSRRPH